jgi:hypothetical protein
MSRRRVIVSFASEPVLTFEALNRVEDGMRRAITTLIVCFVVVLACGQRAGKYVGDWVNVKNPADRLQIRSEGDAFVLEEPDRKKYVGTLTNGVLKVSGPLGSIDILYMPSTDHLIAAGDEYQRAGLTTAVAERSEQQPQTFTCTRSTVRGRDTVIITMPQIHGRELGVIRPGGGLLFIAFRPESQTCRPPVTSDAFLAMTEMELTVNSTVGVSTPCSPDSVRVFDTRGAYEFVISNNLETEDSGSNLRCTIEFR